MSFDLPILPDGWSYAPLETCSQKNSITYGVVQPGAALSDGKPLVRVNNFRDRHLDLSDVMLIAPEIEAKYSRTRLRGGEVLLTVVGSVGQVVVVPSQLAGFNVARAVAVIHPLPHIEPHWIAICLRSPLSQHLLGSRANTTVQTTINLKDVRALPIPLPPETERRVISEFVGAIDDRISLLRETNATLEAIAQALFKSWFVDFDPVRAKMEGRAPEGMDEATAALFPDGLEESELGLMPSGWRVGALGDVLKLRNERVQPSTETATLPYVPIESISARVPFLEEFKSGEHANSSLTMFRKGDVLFGAMRPYFHKVCSAPFDGVTRTTVFTLMPVTLNASAFALFQAFQDSTVDFATQHSEGSTIPYAKWKNSFERMPLVVPTVSVQVAFSDVVSSFVDRANSNVLQAQTLATLRDTLLPRLISGQLRLPEAEAAPEVMT